MVPLLTTVIVPKTSVSSPPTAEWAFGLLARSTTDAVFEAEMPRSRLTVDVAVLGRNRKMPSIAAPVTVLPSILNTAVPPLVDWALMPLPLLTVSVIVTLLLVMMAVKFGLVPASGVPTKMPLAPVPLSVMTLPSILMCWTVPVPLISA